MASALVLVIMAGCAALQYLKGSFIKSFASFMAALCAGFVAFGWFERLADFLFIRRDTMPAWAQLICFLLLFFVSFAILQVIIMLSSKPPVNLGLLPERIGRAVFGLALGLVISGVLLVAVAMAPLSNSYPYPRFPYGTPNPQIPNKALLNPDGFVTGWFSIASSGSLSGTNSFAVMHGDFLNQLFLSRYDTGKGISVLAPAGSIRIPNKAAAWSAPEGLKNTEGRPVPSKSGRELIIVRVGFTGTFVRTGGTFIPGQLRLACKEKNAEASFQDSAESIYPAGYLKTPDQLQTTRLDEQIKVQSSELKEGVKWFDFAFYIPSGTKPVVICFKDNIILNVPPMVSAEQAPK